MSTATRSSATSGRIPWWLKLIMGTLAVVILSCVLVGVTAIFGGVSGTEFSPQTFDRREYSFWQLPLLQIQVWSIHRKNTTGTLEHHLKTNNLIPQSKQLTEWDLVSKRVGVGTQQVNDPQILLNYLDMADSGGYLVWMRWSEDHLEHAKVFWPVIARLVRGNLYVHVREFFRLAREAPDDPQEFESRLHETELKLHRELAARAERMDDKALAFSHYKAALFLAPDDAELKKKVGELEGQMKPKAEKEA